MAWYANTACAAITIGSIANCGWYSISHLQSPAF
jgi:hypothetical protein